MYDDQLINKKFHILQRNKILKNHERFIYNEIANRLNDSIKGINLTIKKSLEIGYSSNNIKNYISSRFKKNKLLTMDISYKLLNELKSNEKYICSDHDKWELNSKKFDLIISNFYLHLSNNFEKLLKNIHLSLNKNGFFIATIPGKNCFFELKDSMINADLEIYGGVYKRFNPTLSIKDLNNILKKNNFKTPFIEIETIYLNYKNFNKLLNDIRYLGNSYLFFDKKKIFENKKFFKKVEEFFWKKYSNKNMIVLRLEIIFFSGWKNNISNF